MIFGFILIILKISAAISLFQADNFIQQTILNIDL